VSLELRGNVLNQSTPEIDPEQVPLPATKQLGMVEVLRYRTMRMLWYAQVISAFGDFLILFAVITVMTFKLRATPQQVTGIQIAYMLPIAVLGIFSGAFIDGQRNRSAASTDLCAAG
jgi:DHA3 family macrolide efflux protein-like MFS transporter